MIHCANNKDLLFGFLYFEREDENAFPLWILTWKAFAVIMWQGISHSTPHGRYSHDRNILLYETTMAYLSASANYNETNSTGYRMAIFFALCVLHIFHMLNELDFTVLWEEGDWKVSSPEKKGECEISSFHNVFKEISPRSYRKSQIFCSLNPFAGAEDGTIRKVKRKI